ncbi:hypothetical protein HDV06_002478 [Boothiomyces sp. JEL0866]|nr:hypothetical protein HDV06_002478 [Boothiomyces sp. JEL0866]
MQSLSPNITQKNPIYPLFEYLYNSKDYQDLVSVLVIPTTEQEKMIFKNLLLAGNVKRQIVRLTEGGVTWKQLLLLGLNKVIVAAFSPDLEHLLEKCF